MPNKESYTTIETPSEGLYSESGSRFLSYAFPCTDEVFIKKTRQALKKQHHKAVHVVYAYRLGADGSVEKSSDDGEPSGTAGKPVLNELKRRQLTEIALFVVRYYGGKKLGIPGLINAYKLATIDALNHATISQQILRATWKITCRAENAEAIRHILLQKDVEILVSDPGEMSTFVIRCHRSESERILRSIANNRQIQYNLIEGQ